MMFMTMETGCMVEAQVDTGPNHWPGHMNMPRQFVKNALCMALHELCL